MFFVGISTHIFIYLLIPAFLIVYFYCRGIQGNPEVEALLPAVAFYEPAQTCYSADTYIYQAASQKEIRQKKPLDHWDETSSRLPEFFSPIGTYTNQTVNFLILRAPPFQRFQ